jgi:hypothetical protein
MRGQESETGVGGDYPEAEEAAAEEAEGASVSVVAEAALARYRTTRSVRSSA